MARTPSKGDLQELRLARLLFFEGAFVRRAIDLNLALGDEFTVTDLDIWALEMTGDLSSRLTIGESKSAEGRKSAKVADRLLWMEGLRRLVGADAATILTAKRVSDNMRGLSERLEIGILDQRDLAHREHAAGIDKNSEWGPFEPELVTRQREIYEELKMVSELKRVYWFLRSEFWLIDSSLGLKRALGALRVVRDLWGGGATQPDRDGLVWLARQAQVNAVVAIARLTRDFYRGEPATARDQLARRLAAGPDTDYSRLIELSSNADRYLTSILETAGVDVGRRAQALGAFMPTPPPYSESLFEVLERLSLSPKAVAGIARFADWRVASCELGRELGPLPGPSAREEEMARSLRLIGSFVNGQIKVPKELLQGVLLDPEVSGTAAPSETGPKQSGAGADPDKLFEEPAAARR